MVLQSINFFTNYEHPEGSKIKTQYYKCEYRALRKLEGRRAKQNPEEDTTCTLSRCEVNPES
jgi:hypothetical protein